MAPIFHEVPGEESGEAWKEHGLESKSFLWRRGRTANTGKGTGNFRGDITFEHFVEFQALFEDSTCGYGKPCPPPPSSSSTISIKVTGSDGQEAVVDRTLPGNFDTYRGVYYNNTLFFRFMSGNPKDRDDPALTLAYEVTDVVAFKLELGRGDELVDLGIKRLDGEAATLTIKTRISRMVDVCWAEHV